MSNQIEYGGSLHSSMRAAADRWAADALPEERVIERDEDAEKAAEELEAFVWGEAQKADIGAPEDVEEDDWRAACRAALVRRIEHYRDQA